MNSIVSWGFSIWEVFFNYVYDLSRSGRWDFSDSSSVAENFKNINFINCFRVEDIWVRWKLSFILVSEGFSFLRIGTNHYQHIEVKWGQRFSHSPEIIPNGIIRGSKRLNIAFPLVVFEGFNLTFDFCR